jgi:hypothetical protein
VIIENVSGAGGMTGVARVAKAPPDGYQFVLGGIDTFAQSQSLYKKPLYNSLADFAPVVLMVEQPLASCRSLRLNMQLHRIGRHGPSPWWCRLRPAALLTPASAQK